VAVIINDCHKIFPDILKLSSAHVVINIP
jgi:hypothetical protein